LLAKPVVPVPLDVDKVTGQVIELFGTTTASEDKTHFW
jgi:hypothetical protein